MADAPVRGRTLTLLAVGFLTLDGVLLLLAALWGRTLAPALGGGACLGVAAVVWYFWRRHQRALADVAEARRALQAEARALRDLLRK
ncbi:MAG TPA: hypothetical protein VH879_09975 [Gemmatimonadales bacterium]|jgi:hypothetical protein